MRILLDTCTFLWLTLDAQEFSEKGKILFRDTRNAVYLSSVSAWEIIVKNQLGKLPLPEDADSFVQRQCEQHRIESLPLTDRGVFQLPHLPRHHRDPFDRMIVCQALANGLTILTPDPLIAQYPVMTAW